VAYTASYWQDGTGGGTPLTGANINAQQTAVYNAAIADTVTKALGTAKGDTVAWSASGTPVREAVGANNQILVADSAQTTGRKWSSNFVSYQAPAFAASFTPVPGSGEVIKVGALTANITVNAVASPVTGQTMVIVLTQDGTGGRTVSWNAAYSVATTLQSAASSRTSFAFVFDGTNWLEL
jgi:hypothetical protein